MSEAYPLYSLYSYPDDSLAKLCGFWEEWKVLAVRYLLLAASVPNVDYLLLLNASARDIMRPIKHNLSQHLAAAT